MESNDYMKFCPKCATITLPETSPFCQCCNTKKNQSETVRYIIDYPELRIRGEEAHKKRMELKRKIYETEIEPLGLIDETIHAFQSHYCYMYNLPAPRDPEPAGVPVNTQNVPKCPICGSTNLQKISATNKVLSAVMFGVFAASHVGKTYKCLNCKTEF